MEWGRVIDILIYTYTYWYTTQEYDQPNSTVSGLYHSVQSISPRAMTMLKQCANCTNCTNDIKNLYISILFTTIILAHLWLTQNISVPEVG